ncbi:hypothetical protein BH18THE2_BH18THE2_14740 [soil metagenome]
MLLSSLKVYIVTSFIILQTLKEGLTSHADTQNRYNMSKKNNRTITTIAVVVFASLFLCSFSLREMELSYGSRGGGLTSGGEGGFSGPGDSPGGGASPPNNPSSPITSGEGRLSGPGDSPGGGASPPNNPSSPITSGETGDSSGHGPVGPHGPYGPGPVGQHEQSKINDNTITSNEIYAPKNTEGSIIVNPQPTPTTTETPSQTDITIAAPASTTTEEEQQQTNNGDESTSAEAQNQIPIANAGPSLTVQPSSNVVLDGTKSYDSNGDPLQFLWIQLAGGPTVPMLNNTTATPSFIAPLVRDTTVLTFQLIVDDGQTDSVPVSTHVTVQP